MIKVNFYILTDNIYKLVLSYERMITMADEKSKTTKLKEKIMMEEPKGINALTKREIKNADEFCKGYKKFIDNSPAL